MNSTLVITSFYKFRRIENPESTRESVEQAALRADSKGLILLGEEGINGSVCLEKKNLVGFQTVLEEMFGPIIFKTSPGISTAFEKLKVKVKREIVTMGAPELRPYGTEGHSSPTEWHQKLTANNPPQILDVRNDYEVRIGKFKGAADFGIEDFSEFPARLSSSGLDKDRETLIYCTGGIRCEKAFLEMKRQGYGKVAQLSGGILKYLEEFGGQGGYEGECFVFDYRVAVDPQLQPSSRFRLCPHCGEPAENVIQCKMCASENVVCCDCLSLDKHRHTCSKNCAHHSRMNNKSTRPPQQA